MTITKKEKVLICGGSSLLSFLWCKAMSEKFEIYLTNNIQNTKYLNLPVVDINFFSVDLIAKSIDKFSFDILINMVGLTNVEKCQLNPEEAFLLNSKVPANLAKACSLTEKKLIHISTDHFFNNEKYPHSEEDEVSLLNIYAKSKYEGEQNVLESCSKALVCRTNFFGYGPPHKMSFSDWIINSVNSKKTIRLHNDVYYTPISGKNLAYYTHKLIELNCSGVFNIAPDQIITKYQFGILLCKFIKIPTEFIISGSIKNRNDLTVRPRSMALCNKKITQTLKKKIGTINEQIESI